MIKPIKNNKQYELALSRIYDLIQKDLKPNSKDSDEIDALSVLVKERENVYFPMQKPTPPETIRFRMEQRGMSGC